MSKKIKKMACIVTMGMVLSTVSYNFVSAQSSTTISSATPGDKSEQDKNESVLKAVIDDENNNNQFITRNVGSKIKFTIDNKWDKY